MGICASTNNTQESQQIIDLKLQKDFEREQRIVKLLLLGPAESGKSTILKQMKIIHNNGYTVEERLDRRGAVHANCIQGAAAIIWGMRKLKIAFERVEMENAADKVQEVMRRSGGPFPEFSGELVQACKAIWADASVQQKLMPRNNEFHFPDTSPYFLGAIDRIACADYVPTEQDILMLRVQTTGIIEVRFLIRTVHFRVFDVSGLRSERKKWIHCFDNVHAIIFVTAISEFDQCLLEDENTNRLLESLRLFRSVVNYSCFAETEIILFLNKTDIFMHKIKKTSIRSLFHSYYGSESYADQVGFLEKKFSAIKADPKKLYVHKTCAINTNQTALILKNVFDAMLQKAFNNSAF